MWGSRVLISCVLVTSACAGDNRLDPSELELRDLLGVAPETAMAWDGDQRAAARQVIDAGMHEAPPAAIHASLGREPTLDRSIANALSVADIDRAKHRLAALGVVELAVGHDELQATPHLSTLASKANVRIELELAGWTDRPGWGQLPARGLDVLTTIATDAGHRSGPVIVTPAPQLAVIAGYVPATSTIAARLYVNPVLLASLEPTNPSALAAVALAAPDQPVRRRGPQVLANDSVGNPYSFYSSVAECANAQATRCEACLPNSNCTPISGSGDGNPHLYQLRARDRFGRVVHRDHGADVSDRSARGRAVLVARAQRRLPRQTRLRDVARCLSRKRLRHSLELVDDVAEHVGRLLGLGLRCIELRLERLRRIVRRLEWRRQRLFEQRLEQLR